MKLKIAPAPSPFYGMYVQANCQPGRSGRRVIAHGLPSHRMLPRPASRRSRRCHQCGKSQSHAPRMRIRCTIPACGALSLRPLSPQHPLHDPLRFRIHDAQEIRQLRLHAFCNRVKGDGQLQHKPRLRCERGWPIISSFDGSSMRATRMGRAFVIHHSRVPGRILLPSRSRITHPPVSCCK